MNTPSFVQFIGLPNKLLFTAKPDKNKRAIGLREFALLKKATRAHLHQVRVIVDFR
jgi:hypothetical protein